MIEIMPTVIVPKKVRPNTQELVCDVSANTQHPNRLLMLTHHYFLFNQPQAAIPTLSPQVYLDAMIRAQGYSNKKVETLKTAYYNKPTPLQVASYDLHLIDVVKAFDHDNLKELMSSGISPNPCNAFGESLVHMVCRRGDAKALELFLENGASLQIADDYGRTPLHDCCWSANPAFDVADKILNADIRLLHTKDARGYVPLSYVRIEHWAAWIEYLETQKGTFLA